MPNQIKYIFSPERLRSNWEKHIEIPVKKTDTADKTGLPKEQSLIHLFDQLKGYIDKRFQGKEREALDLIMKDLKELCLTRSEQSSGTGISGGNLKNNLKIDELLSQIEDLVEALEL